MGRNFQQSVLAVFCLLAVLGCSALNPGSTAGGSVIQRLVSQSFVDSDNGWAVAAECPSTGSPTSMACRSQVYRTKDGGQSWLASAHFLLSPRRIYFVDRNTGWLIGSVGEKCGNDVCPNVVMLSTDGGAKWDRVSTVSGELVDEAAFSGNEVWALGQTCHVNQGCSAEFVRTTTAGQIWDNQDLPLVGHGFRIERFGRTAGWIGGSADNGAGIALFGTVDGGSTWTPMPVPCHETWLRFDFISERDGWLVCSPDAANAGSGAIGRIYRTDDAGQTWSAPMTVADTPTSTPTDPIIGADPVGGIGFSSIDSGWLALRDGRLLATADGGRTWRKILTDAGGFRDVQFVDSSRGWVLGERQVWRTTNAGKTWTAASVIASAPA